MKRTTLRLALLGSLASVAIASAPASAQQQKPNILFILADNVGYGDIGAYGGGELRGAPTPRIDRFAAEGLRLTQYPGRAQLHAVARRVHDRAAIPSAPDCRWSPSRARTSRSPAREITMAEMLLATPDIQRRSSANGISGRRPTGQPQNKGFDEFYGIPPGDTWDVALTSTSIRAGLARPSALDLPLDKGPHVVEAERGEPLRAVKPYTEEVRRDIDWELVDRGDRFHEAPEGGGQAVLSLPPDLADALSKSALEALRGRFAHRTVRRLADGRRCDRRQHARLAQGARCWRRTPSSCSPPTTVRRWTRERKHSAATCRTSARSGPYRAHSAMSAKARSAPRPSSAGRTRSSRASFLRDVLDHGFLPDLRAPRREARSLTTGRSMASTRAPCCSATATPDRVEHLLTFVGSDLVAARWKQFRAYFVDVAPSRQRLGRRASAWVASAPARRR